MTREKFKTYKNVFDDKTLRVLFKLESEGYFHNLVSPISKGKESNVFTAVREDGAYVVVKIYRINSADFKRMYNYICADSRFEGLSNQRRKVIYAWAQREYRNLLVAREYGVDVPTAYAVQENVLVMELIGDEKAAPLLKNKEPKNIKKFYLKVLNNVKSLYKAGFVHGDLSEFNILNYKDKPIIIDFSHGVKLNYPSAYELLERDAKNIKRYFSKYKINIDIENIKNKNGI